MNVNDKAQPCHPEHIRCAQCKLREESVSPGAEILRCAQNDTPDAQYDIPDFGR